MEFKDIAIILAIVWLGLTIFNIWLDVKEDMNYEAEIFCCKNNAEPAYSSRSGMITACKTTEEINGRFVCDICGSGENLKFCQGCWRQFS